jgi:hypothetical protein
LQLLRFPYFRAFTEDGEGKPEFLSRGRIETFENRSEVPAVTYADPMRQQVNPWPIILDSQGEFICPIFFFETLRVVLKDSTGAIQWMQDDVQPSGGEPVYKEMAVTDYGDVITVLSMPGTNNVCGWYYQPPTNTEDVAGGRWQRGDVIFNTIVEAIGTTFWICVAGGSPGEWRAGNNIQGNDLSDLNDVIVREATDGQIIRYENRYWRNKDPNFDGGDF